MFELSRQHIALVFICLMALSIAPLFLMQYPTLDDYFHHLSRVYILEQNAEGPLAQFYEIDWRLVPNLAMDLIVPPLARLMPVDVAGRLFVGMSLILMASGTIALSAALHRSLSWWPLIVFLFLWNRVFLYGFSNYLFTLGLALWALAAWVYWRERRPAGFLVPVFAAIAFVLFICHLYAFGVYGLGVVGYELGRTNWSRNKGAILGDWTIAGLQFVIPVAVFLLQSPTSDYANAFVYATDFVKHKLRGFHHLFFNYHLLFDRVVFLAIAGAVLLALVTRRITIHPGVRWTLVLLMIAYLLMPETFFDTGAADYRLPVPLIFIAIAGTRITAKGLPLPRLAAAALLALFLVRLGLVAERWWTYEDVYQSYLQAIEVIPEGSPMITAATRMPDYHNEFHRPQLMYLSGLAIIHKSVFDPSFATFAHPGKQPVAIRPKYQAIVDELDRMLLPITDTRRFTRTPPLEMLIPPGAEDGKADAGELSMLRHFEYMLLLYPNDDANPAPALLEQLFAGPRFHIYRIKAPETDVDDEPVAGGAPNPGEPGSTRAHAAQTSR